MHLEIVDFSSQNTAKQEMQIMKQHIQQFAAWLKEQDKAEKTVSTYLTALGKFVIWYEQSEGQTFDPQVVTTILIQDYRSYLMNTLEQRPATVNKALATLKSFFAWAVEQKIVAADPASMVRMKRVQQAATRPK